MIVHCCVMFAYQTNLKISGTKQDNKDLQNLKLSSTYNHKSLGQFSWHKHVMTIITFVSFISQFTTKICNLVLLTFKCFRFSSFRFRISSFGFRISIFGFGIPSVGFSILGLRIPTFRFQITIVGFQIPRFVSQIPLQR